MNVQTINAPEDNAELNRELELWSRFMRQNAHHFQEDDANSLRYKVFYSLADEHGDNSLLSFKD